MCCWNTPDVISQGDDAATAGGGLPRGAASSPCYEYFAPDYKLDIAAVTMKDLNSVEVRCERPHPGLS
jgi:hypothetical protein